jgi:hypothetical protein
VHKTGKIGFLGRKSKKPNHLYCHCIHIYDSAELVQNQGEKVGFQRKLVSSVAGSDFQFPCQISK